MTKKKYKYKYKNVEVTCPLCGQKREITRRAFYNTGQRKSTYCRSCAIIIYAAKQKLNTADNDLVIIDKIKKRSKFVTAVLAPCGKEIVPFIGRCPVGDRCKEYFSCLSVAADKRWKGFTLKEIYEQTVHI